MTKQYDVNARIDWPKDLFKTVITITVVDISGMAKLYIDSEADFNEEFLQYSLVLIVPKVLAFYFPLIPAFSLWRRR